MMTTLSSKSSVSDDSDSTFGEPSSPPLTPSDSDAVGVQSTCSSDGKTSSTLTSPQDDSLERLTRPKHSLEAKRIMRNQRKKRKRLQSKTSIAKLKNELCMEKKLVQSKEGEVLKYKSMSRSYWDRWQWELLKRKEAMRDLVTRNHQRQWSQSTSSTNVATSFHEITPNHLTDPIHNGKPTVRYIGRGSFSVVRLQVYRDMIVAVKELLPRTLLTDVIHEANMLNRLCHPYLPFLFGVCTSAHPFRIVTQFHGINSNTVNLRHELLSNLNITNVVAWITLCTQIIEAMCYLHSEAGIIHNDIKADNILLSDNAGTQGKSSSGSEASAMEMACKYHAVLIDFGKATGKESGRLHKLSDQEKMTYICKYRHIAPEVVHGEYKQSIYSDIYSLGQVLVQISDRGHFSSLSATYKKKLLSLIDKCRSVQFQQRPNSEQCLKQIKVVMQSL